MNSFSNNFTAVYLPISNSENQFQVNHVYCVGRNYTEHAIEMGEDDRQPPFFFSKPNWAVTSNDVPYPLKTKNLQHEVELVLALGENANIFGISVGVDLTRRDLQADAKWNAAAAECLLPYKSGKRPRYSYIKAHKIMC